ncbi:MAG: M18 family aminopeptidase [Peptoniphilaceae bacterium]|uniref:M18 family aminopeptidase n=1 Tax=Parvimonas sp. TaxID=1944660 RepID=UPI0025D722BA|nr:M18 family aminopeptidase [Parvimonas sp.]MCI5997417.1 M18 family aminopeptidase [Parvimonas sp.]MDD7765496.1 M18 family aminopeptidase [Peptoniphilaceae bacterium]MDY3051037.1 M18 family aminopeptidase [Parvimonas sp.]
MNNIQISQELLSFIDSSKSMFHSVDTMKKYFDKAGYTFLPESTKWEIKKGGNYYTTRNNSSILAFQVGELLDDYHFQITASHSDSPTYKVKAVPELEGPFEFLRLNVEGYGGMIDSSWFDRPLSIAGRVLIRENGKIVNKLFNIDKDILMIPNVAIHLNREVNNGYAYNKQVDLLPLFSAGELKKGDFDKMVADELGVKVEDVISKDLFLVNRQRQCIWGYKDEFVSTPKLDDLQCAFTSMKAFLDSKNEHSINVCVVFDNEEVGSNTKQGAMSTFMKDALMRVNSSLGFGVDEYHQAVAKSFLVSCDNAHALHPNHPELYDQTNRTYLNKGIVIKEAANQKYTTDAFSRAIFLEICKRVDVPVQFFANRSDKVGGSTLGNLSNIQVSLHALDIGIAQLAMHSSYETCGIKDTAYMIEALKEFYSTNIKIDCADGAIFE